MRRLFGQMERIAANSEGYHIGQVVRCIREKRKTLALKPGQGLKDHKAKGEEQCQGQAKLGAAPRGRRVIMTMVMIVMGMMSVIVHTPVRAPRLGRCIPRNRFPYYHWSEPPLTFPHEPSMKDSTRRFVLCLACALSSFSFESFGASILDYRLKAAGAIVEQHLEIQKDQAWIRGLGGDAEMDLLFDGQSGQWAVIDRRRKAFTAFSEKSVRQLAEQLELVAPLVKGLGEQMGSLSPDQKQQWGRLLENIPVEEINRLQKTAKKTKLVATGKPQRVEGIACRPFKVDSSATHLDFCIAEPSALALPEEDARTLARMMESSRAMILNAGALSARFGLNLAANDLTQIAGLPLAFREGGSKPGMDLKFVGAKSSEHPLRSPEIPTGFHQEKIKLW